MCARRREKVFCLFFSKKEALALLVAAAAPL
jgi:hypothetical protein